MTLPFDRVADDVSGDVLTVEEFLELPLEKRVGLVLQRRLRFFADTVEIARGAALRALNALSRDADDAGREQEPTEDAGQNERRLISVPATPRRM